MPAPATGPASAGPGAAGLLIGHGSPDPRHAATLRRLTSQVDLARAPGSCELAFLDHDQPRLSDWLAARPAGDAVSAIGLLLTSGYHAQVDIPRELAAASTRLDITDLGTLGAGEALGTHGATGPEPWTYPVLELLVSDAGATPASAVVLVAAGSTQEQARVDLQAVRAEWQSRRSGRVLTAAVSGPDPRPSDVIEAHRADTAGLSSDLVVVPFMLAPGALADRATHAAAVCGARVTETISTPDRTPPELVAHLVTRLTP